MHRKIVTRKISCSLKRKMAQIFAISDIHVDHFVNNDWIKSLDGQKYANDVLLLAGDVTDSMDLLRSTLESLRAKFKDVFYVPGNHELWIRDKSSSETSVDKFHRILELCQSIGVLTEPRIVETPSDPVWVVPLFSWYATPEDDRGDSLFVSGSYEDPSTKQLWMDNHMCKWPSDIGSRSKYFAALNKDRIRSYDAPVITFSHFLPRVDLIRAEEDDENSVKDERRRLGLPLEMPKRQGAMAGFNFTRYAGCKSLDKQIREIGSLVHVYGHQHRNRDRVVDGVRYVSHCLGYKKERDEGFTYGITKWQGPKLVWPNPTALEER